MSTPPIAVALEVGSPTAAACSVRWPEWIPLVGGPCKAPPIASVQLAFAIPGFPATKPHALINLCSHHLQIAQVTHARIIEERQRRGKQP